jgi:hypothetical protein
VNGWLILAAFFTLGVIAGGAWAAAGLRSGPGPHSRLERILAAHDRDEARRKNSSEDEEGAAR